MSNLAYKDRPDNYQNFDSPTTQGEYKDIWKPLRPHLTQYRVWRSKSRFNLVAAGRRSGKTELEKRKVVMKILRGAIKWPDYRAFVAAPTRTQAKDIYWDHLKQMVPPLLLAERPRETGLKIKLINGSSVHVLGMDKPERAEGVPWNHGVLDEYGNMKKDVWPLHIRPSLADRGGSCDFIGVPEGRNHYYDLDIYAKEVMAEAAKTGRIPEWSSFWWPSSDILSAEEMEAARRDSDDLTFQQEYEAAFVNFSGMAYHNYSEKLHCGRLSYDPEGNLVFCFDFNVSPGTACVLQMQDLPSPSKQFGSGVIGEVFIKRHSNTLRVCDKLIEDWGNHKGKIFIYGDSTGGAEGSAKVLGSDWQLIKQKLYSHFGGDRIVMKVPKSNPRERDRLNSVNSRLLSYNGLIRLMVDPRKAPNTHRDFEGTILDDSGTGKIDKKVDPQRSHITDAIGYHIYKEWPMGRLYVSSGQRYWN